MDARNIIPQGERAKYIVKSDKLNFNFEEYNYRLEIIYGMMNQKIVIKKDEFQFINRRWVISFPTDGMVGPVKARLVMYITDDDCPEDVREEVDEQYIGFVVTTPCPQFLKCPCDNETHDIHYYRTERSDLADLYARLTDKDGFRFITDDECFLFVIRDI